MERNLRTAAKRSIKRALVASGTLRVARRFVEGGALVLMYHSVVDNPQLYENSIGTGITCSSSIFREEMEYICRKYHPVVIDDLLLFLRGQKEVPPNAVVITFDDGYADNLLTAAPILNHLGIRATFYVTVNCVETGKPPWPARVRYAFANTKKQSCVDPLGRARPLQDSAQREIALLLASEQCAALAGDAQEKAVQAIEHGLETEPLTASQVPMLTWDQARKLSQSGHIIGSHTLTHPNLAYIQEDELSLELMESRCRLEKQLSVPVGHFSYPCPALEPHWTERTVGMTGKAGYLTAVTSNSGLVRSRDNPLLIRRFPAPTQMDEFTWGLECSFLGRKM